METRGGESKREGEIVVGSFLMWITCSGWNRFVAGGAAYGDAPLGYVWIRHGISMVAFILARLGAGLFSTAVIRATPTGPPKQVANLFVFCLFGSAARPAFALF